jgi:hypothetical protein
MGFAEFTVSPGDVRIARGQRWRSRSLAAPSTRWNAAHISSTSTTGSLCQKGLAQAGADFAHQLRTPSVSIAVMVFPCDQ